MSWNDFIAKHDIRVVEQREINPTYPLTQFVWETTLQKDGRFADFLSTEQYLPYELLPVLQAGMLIDGVWDTTSEWRARNIPSIAIHGEQKALAFYHHYRYEYLKMKELLGPDVMREFINIE